MPTASISTTVHHCIYHAPGPAIDAQPNSWYSASKERNQREFGRKLHEIGQDLRKELDGRAELGQWWLPLDTDHEKVVLYQNRWFELPNMLRRLDRKASRSSVKPSEQSKPILTHLCATVPQSQSGGAWHIGGPK